MLTGARNLFYRFRRVLMSSRGSAVLARGVARGCGRDSATHAFPYGDGVRPEELTPPRVCALPQLAKADMRKLRGEPHFAGSHFLF